MNVMQLFENGNYMFWLYVGCAYGLVAGVSGRVGNHEDPEHRAKHGSYHYKTMEQPGVQSNFLLLVRFASKVHPVVVFLAESAMALLFGAYLPKKYQEIRAGLHPDLRQVDPRHGTNRSDPLCTLGQFDEINELSRINLRRRLKHGGWFKICQQIQRGQGGKEYKYYYFSLSQVNIHIHSKDAEFLQITDGCWIKLQAFIRWNTKDRFARQAIVLDPAYYVALWAEYTPPGTIRPRQTPLKRLATSTIAIANSIFYIIQGEHALIGGDAGEETWGSHCFPLWGKYAQRIWNDSWESAWGDREKRKQLNAEGSPQPEVKWDVDDPNNPSPKSAHPIKKRANEILDSEFTDSSEDERLLPKPRINVEWFAYHSDPNMPMGPSGRKPFPATLQVDVAPGENISSRIDEVKKWFSKGATNDDWKHCVYHA